MLDPVDQWMVKSNLKTIKDGKNPQELIATLHHNGYHKVADAVQVALYVYPNHPETQPNEHFLYNTQVANWPKPHLNTLKTLRLGNQAYDINGNPLHENEGMKPVFINNNESNRHDKLMMQHTFG